MAINREAALSRCEARRFKAARELGPEPGPTKPRTQYEMEALESRHGPDVWTDHPTIDWSFSPEAQDAVDDHRLTNPRKRQPVATGVLAYFPDAILEVARVSEAGNRQHGTIGWDRTKSTDEFDALTRHLIDHLRGNIKDSDGVLHLAKAAWRALAALQRHLDSVK